MAKVKQVGLLAAGCQPWNKDVCAASGDRFAYCATLAIYIYQVKYALRWHYVCLPAGAALTGCTSVILLLLTVFESPHGKCEVTDKIRMVELIRCTHGTQRNNK